MPNKNINRLGRIEEEFKKEMSSIISYDLKEPKVTGLVSVTRVKVTPDLRYAKVWVSIVNAKNTEETERLQKLFFQLLLPCKKKSEQCGYAQRRSFGIQGAYH